MSCSKVNQPVAVPERVIKVMRMITHAAERGLAAPKNDELAHALGANSVSAGANIVSLLETMGLIEVKRYQCGRVIKVASTGQSTLEPDNRKLHWSVRGVVRQTRRTADPKDAVARRAGSYRGPVPENQLVDRDPCRLCGVRGDIGCRHHPITLSSEVSA